MRTTLLAAMLAIAPAYVAAQSPYSAPATRAAPDYAPLPDTPDQMLRRGIDRLTGFLMAVPDPEPGALRRFLEREIAPHFDFAYMARWAAGPMYRRMSPGQHARMTRMLKELFLDALARNLGTYAHPLPRVDVYPARAGAMGNQATVSARVVSPNGLLAKLVFRFYWNRDRGWRIFDVTANGASAVAFYRGYFAQMFRRHGPDVVLR